MTADSRKRYVVGVDVGGTNIVVGALATDGRAPGPAQSAPTHVQDGPDAIPARIVRMVEDAISDTTRATGARRADFLGVGVGAPGPLDRTSGLVIVAPNLGWHNYPLRDYIAERIALPVTLDNDANCATLGEWWLGAGRGTRHLIGITIGTGIGGGLILNGELYHGASDVAGEIGHTTIETQGRHCSCGNYGCLEAYASGTAIAARALEALAHDGSSVLREMVDGDLGRITAQTVYEASERGDATAREVMRETARFLGAGIANLLNIFNPEAVVVAGGVTRAGATLFDPMRAEVRRRAFKPAWEAARIVPGELSGTAGVAGAVGTFLHQRGHVLVSP
jgi:glucokinase